LVILFQRRGALPNSLRAWGRPAALLGGAAVAILLTPYGLSMIGYYHSTMVSSTLRHAVTEWQPVTSVPLTAAALLLVAGIAVWSFGRRPERTTLWEKLALVILAAGAISVVRNALFFGLFALTVLPVSLAWGRADAGAGTNAGSGSASRRLLINGALAAVACAALVIATAATLLRPASGLEYGFQRPGVLSAVERVTRADSSLLVTADPRFTDWLLWRDPALAGRLAYDVRYELLTAPALGRLEALFSQSTPDWKAAAHGYRVVVLSRVYDPGAYSSFKSEPGRRILYSDGDRLVVLRSAAEAAR
jgi:hypothetical protein